MRVKKEDPKETLKQCRVMTKIEGERIHQLMLVLATDIDVPCYGWFKDNGLADVYNSDILPVISSAMDNLLGAVRKCVELKKIMDTYILDEPSGE